MKLGQLVVPKKPKKKAGWRSSHPSVIKARKEASDAQSTYEADKSEGNHEAWKQALSNLYVVYDQIKEQDIDSHIKNIEATHGAQQYGEAWRTVNEITGRKQSKEGQVAGASPQERVTTWFTHFKNLLGSPPEVDDPDEEIEHDAETAGLKGVKKMLFKVWRDNVLT